MKLNFYRQLLAGFDMIRSNLQDDRTAYTQAFLNVNWEKPDPQDRSAATRYDRRQACFQAILGAAGFAVPQGHQVRFVGTNEINNAIGLDPRQGLTVEEAGQWFT
jgi:hypothetical protein